MGDKILLIEDNEKNRYLVSFLLEKNGFHVIQVNNGRSGIEMAGKENPDLILLDIQLPVMDGYEVARALRSDEKTKNIPIVAVTSYAMKGDKEKALAAGCTGYIEKPIDTETFIDDIMVFLKE